MSPLHERTLHRYTFGSLLRILSICGLILILVGYMTYQARNIIQGPQINLTDTYTPVSEDRLVLITGNTKNIVRILVNGREIHTTSDGTFAHRLILENGYTIVTLSAHDRFGRSTTITRSYVYVGMPT